MERDAYKKDKAIVVFGIYETKSILESAVDRLKREGFRSSDISVLMSDPDSSMKFAHQKETKAPEGATTGAGTGAVLGGTLGWLVGVGALAIPGLGPFVAAGPIMAALAGAAAGGAIGAVSGALIGLGIPEYEAKRFEGMVRDGGILISVHCDDHDWKKKAIAVLEETGGKDVSSSSEVPDPNLRRVHHADLPPKTF
ncbi:MAG: general stress protein [Pseudobdellovibrionaceae bacterium]